MTQEDRATERLCEILRAHLAGNPIALPEGAAPLWRAFCDLSEARSWHMNGPNPISWSDIAAWRELTGWPLEPRHVRVIRRLDQAWMESFHDRQESGQGTPVARPGAEVTATLFDAVFKGKGD